MNGFYVALLGVYLLVTVGLTVVAAVSLGWMLYAWRGTDSAAETGFRTAPAALERLSFSLIVPARHEHLVLGRTLARLATMEYKDYEVIVVVGHDDPKTEEVARASERAWPERVRVLVDHSAVKSKPVALNAGLRAARGDIVGVFDAEDIVHPSLLGSVQSQFIGEQCDAVQAGVQLVNYWSSWYALRNVLEYYLWFRSRLHLQAQRRFIPLGGNTVFVYRRHLVALGGWDERCLAEDCDLGVRLSVAGAAISVAYDPRLVTQEEAPTSLRVFVKQRTRWDQGFLQVLLKRDWRALPTRGQRWHARAVLAMPLVQAAAGLLVPVSIATMIFASLPAGVAVASYLPLAIALVTLLAEGLSLREFGRDYHVRIRTRDYVRLTIGMIPYQIVLAFAAVRGVSRHLLGHDGWEKTHHSGAHYVGDDELAVLADALAPRRGETTNEGSLDASHP